MRGDGSFGYDRSRDKLTYDYYDNAGRHCKKRFANTKAGERERDLFARKTRSLREQCSLISPCSLSLGEWIVHYMVTYLKPKYREQTFLRAKQTAKKLEPIYQFPLGQIGADQIQGLYNTLYLTLAPASVSKVHKLLVGAFKKAMILRKISYNPMDAVEPPKIPSAKIEIFTLPELLRIFRVLKRNTPAPGKPYNARRCQQPYYTFFYLLLVTGMRVGELCALRFEDIDFTKREIHVSRTKVGRVGNNFNAPKTRSGDRYIPIVYKKAVERIKALRREDNVTRLTGLLFQTKYGNAWNYNNIRKIWNKTCDQAEVVGKNIHVFRHTFATAALAHQLPILEVSRILGHASSTTTLNMYGHAIPSYNQKIIEKFNKKRPKNSLPTKTATTKL